MRCQSRQIKLDTLIALDCPANLRVGRHGQVDDLDVLELHNLSAVIRLATSPALVRQLTIVIGFLLQVMNEFNGQSNAV